MEQRKEDITRRPLYVYDLPQDILSTLARKDDSNDSNDDTYQADTNPPTDTTERVIQTKPGDVGSKSCSLCGVTFYTVGDQKSHVRSDFHNYNLKQKIRGAKAVTEIEFEKLVGDLDESLSGSDSSDTEEDEEDGGRKETTLSSLLKKQAVIASTSNEFDDNPGLRKRTRGSGKAPMIWFTTPTMPKNTYLGIYRAIFTNEELEKETPMHEIVQRKQLSPKPQIKVPVSSEGVPLPESYKGPHIFMCMIGGGHFAAMVVSLAPKQVKNPQATTGPLTKEAVVLAHKTFHRYTTRRKQGGAQSANDSAKGAAHSAGSSLRRYNEQALQDEVRQLLTSWKGMIDTSELLFIRATGTTNRRTLFGPYDDQVLKQNDPRIRGFPFSTKRATQNELMRSFVELTRVKILEVDEEALAAKRAAILSAQQSLAAKKEAAAASKSQAKRLTEEEETALLHTSQLQSLIRRSKLPALLSYLQTNSVSPNFHFQPEEQNYHAPTPLHLAASLNSKLLVEGLLLKGNADPTIKNGDGKTAFELCGERSTRDAFRVCRYELPSPKGYTWENSNVPSGLSREEAGKRDAREKEEENKKKMEEKRIDDERLAKEEEERERERNLKGGGKFSSRGGKGKIVGAGVQASGQEKREQEMRDMTPEMKMRVERERRARAAEERMKRLG
ncbi:putative ankyrin repeat-containing protein [Botrytis fragariae]|uniref:Putative ankyrin repeat-containing protein n=1 Tax=Botrytis fragariae TaxID=1964551 RepID=A0A8H6B213_9HELO|nr:putative ankyrin repeat-containing protein [Botrytis fragariae]KAF5877655.1 putative ankyrin repeat-containing protein [Botrytis fragariae]